MKHQTTPIENYDVLELLKTENRKLLSEKNYHEAKCAELSIEVEYLKHELDKLKRMIFGSTSERFVPISLPGQLTLDLGSEELKKDTETPETETLTYTRKKNKKENFQGHGRGPLPSHLPRREYIIEPTEDITNAIKIGEEITEKLEYKPGELYVSKFVRSKYVLPDEKGIVIGTLPSFPIPRGNANSSLLAYIIISKFVDHLPFYRLVQMFKRQGIQLPESTINDWFRKSCELLLPLYKRLKTMVQSQDYLMADETPISVLTNEKKGSTHKGYLWVYYSPPEKLVCFDYRKGRSREGPYEFLSNFHGSLQCDAYQAYNMYEDSPDVILLGCMAHARRKFDEALTNDKARAEHVLAEIQKLYSTERKARELSLLPVERKALREKESLSVLTELEWWLKEQLPEVLPKSPIGVAINYTLGIWKRLMRYLNDGRFEIDNNLVENSIRPVALGRKNYLFAGSHEGAERAAMMYSFLGTCKINNIEPMLWLTDVLTRISDCKISQLDQLLPHLWSPAK